MALGILDCESGGFGAHNRGSVHAKRFCPKLAQFGRCMQGQLLEDYNIRSDGDLHQAMVDVRGLAQVSLTLPNFQALSGLDSMYGYAARINLQTTQ